jgi:hypothetical protein
MTMQTSSNRLLARVKREVPADSFKNEKAGPAKYQTGFKLVQLCRMNRVKISMLNQITA